MRHIRAVVFDAFGTLCEITDSRRPFLRLAVDCADRKRARNLLMTRPLANIQKAAAQLKVDSVDIDSLETDLAAELASVRLYPEVIEILVTLRARGLKLAIASNLATPYAQPLLRLLPFEFDAYAWSFEVGYMKPDPRIFAWVCKRLNFSARDILMVGDTFAADYQGAVAGGLHAVHLDRNGTSNHRVHTIRTLKELIRCKELVR